MPQRREVKCINKHEHHNPHERITHIGGDGWRITSDQAIALLDAKTDEFYVSAGGHTVDVIVAYHGDRPYLKTKSDGYSPDNLLSLPECGGGGGEHGRRDQHDRPAQPNRGHACS